MRIYTRTGDGGETGLWGGRRVPKDDLVMEACGTVDELNAQLGVCRALADAATAALLARVQSDLLHLGAELAGAGGAPRLQATDVAALEAAIDRVSAELPPLRQFILPAGGISAASLHVARTVARRAERRCVALRAAASVSATLLAYLNRLSDLLFVLARQANLAAGAPEEPWTPR